MGKGKGKGKGKGGDPGEKPDGCKSLMVRNLKSSVDEDALWEVFANASKVKVVTDRETGEPRGFAFVDFDEDDQVDEAIKLHNTEGQRQGQGQGQGWRFRGGQSQELGQHSRVLGEQ